MEVSSEIKKSYQLALDVRKNAYAPYSNFKVGSAIKFKGHDKVFVGCNVENASYGGCICAERNAILNSVATIGKSEIEYVIVVTHEQEPAVPCALCLQTFAEFYEPSVPVYLANLDGIKKVVTFKDLLPIPFNSFTS